MFQNLQEELVVLDTRVQLFIDFYRKDLDFSQKIYSEWTAKDILGHILMWHESFARNVRDLAQGKTPHPLKGKLSEVNEAGVQENRPVPISTLLQRLETAQSTIREYITDPKIKLIPYKKGSRDYTPSEHLEIVQLHIKRHLKDMKKVFA